MRARSPSASCRCACRNRPTTTSARAIAGVRDAASKGAQLICLPELFRSRYFCQSEEQRTLRAGRSGARARPRRRSEALAAELGITLIASLFERRAPGLYHNTAAVLDARRGLSRQVSQDAHSRRSAVLREVLLHARRPGLQGVFDTRAGNVGVLVCWDQWYPEAARLTALAGAEILFYPTAIGWHPEEREDSESRAARRVGNRRSAAHAIANGCYRGGRESHRLRTRPDRQRRHQVLGAELRRGADGSIVVRASNDRDEVVVCELDLASVGRQRVGWPFFRDRRIDAYSEITRRFID